MLEKLIPFGSVVATLCVAILLQVTNPATIGPLGIFVLFILVYLSVLGVLTYLIFWISLVVSKLILFLRARPPIQPLSFRRSYYFSSVTSLAPLMIIGMQSVGEVGIYETLLIVFFTAIACVYIAKRTS